MIGHLTLLSGGILLGSLVQGVTGFGLGLVALPILAITRPDSLPQLPLLLLVPTTAWIAFRNRASVDGSGIFWLSVGRLPSVPIGLLVLNVLSPSSLKILVGILLLAASCIVRIRLNVIPTRPVQLITGFASGLMSTTAGLGGPPQALIYSGRSGPELRATISLATLVGIVMTLSGLALAGRIHIWHILLSVQLLPALALGLWISQWVVRALDGVRFQSFVTGTVFSLALVVIWDGVNGIS